MRRSSSIARTIFMIAVCDVLLFVGLALQLAGLIISLFW